MYFGASGSYFFSPSLGVQLSGGYLKSDVPMAADFTMAWTWSSQAGGGGANQSAGWTGPGSLSVMPVCLNLIARFGSGSLDAYVSGGPTLFNNSFQASTTVGYGISWTQSTGTTLTQQWIDALPIPADIPKTSWTAFGGNAGAGLGFKFSSSLALVVEARYFFCPKKDLSWLLSPGTYSGIFYTTIKNQVINDADIEFMSGNMTTFQVNPSFLLIAAGIKISI
jgi:opacity protein-like surface antigen